MEEKFVKKYFVLFYLNYFNFIFLKLIWKLDMLLVWVKST